MPPDVAGVIATHRCPDRRQVVAQGDGAAFRACRTCGRLPDFAVPIVFARTVGP